MTPIRLHIPDFQPTEKSSPNMIRPILLCLLLLASLTAPAQEAPKVSLNEAINYAFENNLNLKNAQISLADAKEQIVERRAFGIPKLSVGADYQYFIDIPTQILPDFISPAIYGILDQEGLIDEVPAFSDSGLPAQFGTKHNLTARADLNTMIFDGSYFVGLKAAREFKDYTLQQVLATRQEVKYRVTDAYLPVLFLQENLQTLDDNIANLSKLRFETNAMYEQGFVEQLDVDRLDLSLANLQTERDNLQRQKEVALNALKFAMGYPVDQPLEIEGDLHELVRVVDESWLTNAINYQTRPEYLVAEKGVRLNELNVQLNQSRYLPVLNAFASYQQSLFANKLRDGEWFPTTVAGLSLKVPIFDGLEKKAQVERARLDLEMARNQQRELAQAIELEASNARTSYLNSRERLANQEKNLKLAERIFNTTQVKYREGVGSSLELTQAEQGLYQSQQNYNQALYDLLQAKTALDKALGK